MDFDRTQPRTTAGQNALTGIGLFSLLGFVISLWKIEEPFQTSIQVIIWLNVLVISIIACIKDRPLIEPEAVDALQEKLVVASVGSCTCGVKTDDLDHHAKPCPYRVMMEAYDFLEPYGGPRHDPD